MRSIVFFPGFEPESVDWLKFALLYLDEVQPIVPESADVQLSSSFLDVVRYTDLISLYRPRYQEGALATVDAIDQVERIMQHPGAFEHLFHTRRIDLEWRRPSSYATELWDEKFSAAWIRFCLENQFGRESDHGVVIPASLASVYMTILANCIADTHGISAVSDNREIADFSLVARRPAVGASQEDAVILGISLPAVLPGNLSDVDMTAVMRLRNSEGFAKKRRALHEIVDRVAASIEGGKPDADLGRELGSTFRDFSDDIASIGSGLATTAFGIWLVASGSSFGPLDAVRQILIGTTFTIGSILTVRRSWAHSHTKRLARRYVMDVNRLNADGNEKS